MFSLFSIIVIVVLFVEIKIFNAFHLRIPYKISNYITCMQIFYKNVYLTRNQICEY